MNNLGIGERMKMIRLEHNLSTPDIANLISVSRHAVYKYETAQIAPTYEKLKDFATIFHLSLDWLITGQEPRQRMQSADQLEPHLDQKERDLIEFIRAHKDCRELFFKYMHSYQTQAELSKELNDITPPATREPER